jgi:mono/diheme cytochrome c family protein
MHRHLVAALAASLGLVACRTADRDLPAVYRDLSVPQGRLASADVQRQGRAIFHERCTPCHGELADGKGVRAAGLTPPPPDLTDGRWRALTDERHVYYAIAEGGHGTPMPPWKATLSPGEIWSLVAYVRAIAGHPLGAAAPPTERRAGPSRADMP